MPATILERRRLSSLEGLDYKAAEVGCRSRKFAFYVNALKPPIASISYLLVLTTASGKVRVMLLKRHGFHVMNTCVLLSIYDMHAEIAIP